MPPMRELTIEAMVWRIIIAIMVGGAIGMDRGLKNRPAGLRTYMLVSIGSCVVMMLNQYVYLCCGTGDPTRMGAQVVSGIGFLGAGTILVTSHNRIRGLTTAAGLWASACIGLAIGIGLYEAALTAGTAVFAVLTLLQRADSRMRSRCGIAQLYVELEQDASLGMFIRSCKAMELRLSDLERESGCGLTVTVRTGRPGNPERILAQVRSAEGVRCAERL